MKQRKYGQKIQNWHRPLGRDALGTRFRRLRDQDPSLVTSGGISHEAVDDFDYFWDDDGDVFGNDSDSLAYWHGQLCSEVLHQNRPLRPLMQRLPARPWGTPKFPDDASPAELIAQLYAHVDQLTQYQGDNPALVAQLRDALDPQSQALVEQHVPQSASTLCLFAPFWCRPPQTWKPESGSSLVEHLFVLYPVPAFLRRAMERPIPFPSYKWLCWFILLGRSISLKTASATFGWNLAKKFPHFLFQVPERITPRLACACAEVLRLGGTLPDFRQLSVDESYRIDPTELRAEDPELAFWHETVRWLVAHRSALPDTDIRPILAWARHRHTEARARRQTPFHWSGRSARAVVEQSTLYHQNRYTWHYWGQHYTWKAHGWNWAGEAEELAGWSITELTQSYQLGEEGAALHHCVGGYGRRCFSGESAIFSVRYQGKRRVTVEINPTTRTLVQVHGSYNRVADPNEQRVVAHWQTSVVLPV